MIYPKGSKRFTSILCAAPDFKHLGDVLAVVSLLLLNALSVLNYRNVYVTSYVSNSILRFNGRTGIEM